MMNDAETEAVARAIAPKAWAAYGLIGRDSLAQESRRTASMRHAQVAISALRAHDVARGMVTVPRVPTEGMVGVFSYETWERPGRLYNTATEQVAVCWQAMIAAAEACG